MTAAATITPDGVGAHTAPTPNVDGAPTTATEELAITPIIQKEAVFISNNGPGQGAADSAATSSMNWGS
ncbi:hypothetical protein HK101_005012, partial [Irineochytrium annulatum]